MSLVLRIRHDLIAFVDGRQSVEPPDAGMTPIAVLIDALTILLSEPPGRRRAGHELAALIHDIDVIMNAIGGSSSCGGSFSLMSRLIHLPPWGKANSWQRLSFPQGKVPFSS